MTIRNCWITGGRLILETPDRRLYVADISPYRDLDDDAREYDGDHPRQLHGVSLPDELYSLYGLVKDAEQASEVLHVRMTPSELQKLKEDARADGKRMSDYVRAKLMG